MVRTGCLALAIIVAGACGTTTDDRPATLASITESILKPSCAAAECHSTFRQQNGYQFDTVDGARYSISQDSALVDTDHLNDPQRPPTLILNLTLDQAAGNNMPVKPRMPYDGPLPNADIDLIEKWLNLGLPGICDPGAATQCLGKAVVACTADGAYDLTKLLMKTLCPDHMGDPKAQVCSHGACQ